MTPRVAVFARAPVLGQVKTRLAATTDAETAFDCHVALTESVLDRLCCAREAGRFRVELWLAGDENEITRTWCQRFGVACTAQGSGDLGQKMLHAFRTGVSVVVGTDIPDLTAGYVRHAIDLLDRYDLVLGPTEDGGYCLVAMQEARPRLFEDMPWGTREVAAETRRRAAVMGLDVAELSVLWDVDDERDWRRWRDGPGQKSIA